MTAGACRPDTGLRLPEGHCIMTYQLSSLKDTLQMLSKFKNKEWRS